jgi:ElaB/YqjD/DUF883 family membrane-anchored ribosome-binding protein
MEVYFKDLISKEASLDKLVDDLMLVVQGAEEFADAAAAVLPPEKREELRTRLQRLKEACRTIKQQTISTAVAADKVLHRYPYSSMGLALGLGLLAGLLVRRSGGGR